MKEKSSTLSAVEWAVLGCMEMNGLKFLHAVSCELVPLTTPLKVKNRYKLVYKYLLI